MSLDKFKKFLTTYKEELEGMNDKEKEEHVKSMAVLLAIVIVGILVGLAMVLLLSVIIGKLLPFIIAAAVGVGGYVWFKKNKK